MNRSLAVGVAVGIVLGIIVVDQVFGMVAGLSGGKAAWLASRAAGMVAYGALGLSTVWGLLTSSRLFMSRLQPPLTLELHKVFSFIGLGALAFHGGALLYDVAVPFRLWDVAVPFLSEYRTVEVGVGIVASYLMVLLSWSFYVRQRIGPKVWRSFHYAGFIAFVLATGHGLFAGTDAGLGWIQAVYMTLGASVLFLTYVRILGGRYIPSRRPAGIRSARHDNPDGVSVGNV